MKKTDLIVQIENKYAYIETLHAIGEPVNL